MRIERLKIIAEHVADWLDDRWTWTAIGLLTGYFGFGSADSMEWKAWQEAGISVASLVLILVRDQKRRPLEPPPKSGWNDANEAPPIERTGKYEGSSASPAANATLRAPVVDHRGIDAMVDGLQRVPPNSQMDAKPSTRHRSNDKFNGGWGDRS